MTDHGKSQRQARILLWSGFGGLLLLMAVLGLSALSFTSQIEVRQETIRKDYVERDLKLEKLWSGIYVSGTYARDYLLDDNELTAQAHKAAFLAARRQIESEAAAFERLVPADERVVFDEFNGELRAYLDAVDPALRWTPEQRRVRGKSFIDSEVLPRRMAVVDLADQIHALSERRLDANSDTVRELFSSFRMRLVWLLVSTLGTGILLAGLSLRRILALERETGLRFQEVLKAQRELKRLSAELLSAQEDERRRISRELHDEVGQVLSAIVLGIGNVRSAIEHDEGEKALRQLQLVQEMTQRNANVVRNISLLLRPTMLDDLGLLPALKWLSREISRTSGIAIDVIADGVPDDLTADHRTCIYRVVQEAVNNAARHSDARRIRICVSRTCSPPAKESCLLVSIQDDGKGFDPLQQTGLGILGMGERIKRLGGVINFDSEAGRGSIVSFELPVPKEAAGSGDKAFAHGV